MALLGAAISQLAGKIDHWGEWGGGVTDGRQIEEKHMLEVGHIENQLKKREHENRTRIRSDTRNEVSLLYDIRNSLSHLELFDHIRLSELESRFQPKEEQRIRARKPKD